MTVLVLVLVLVLIAALVVAALIALGFLDLRPLRASASEAGERTSDLAAEFFEWLRTGR